MSPRRALRRTAPFLLYAALFVASFYPQSLRPWDTVAYIGDSLASVWSLAWNVHQLFRNPLDLFEANYLYPTPSALAFDEHGILQSVLVAPVVWATENPVLAYNVALALACLLAAGAGRYVARSLGLDGVGAWTAGALYAFHTYQVNEGPRMGIVFHGFLPLALAQLVLYLKSGRARHVALVGAFMLLQGLASNYNLLYGSLLVAIITLAALATRPRVMARRLPLLALSAATAALLFLPVAWPYVKNARTHGYERELPRGVDLQHYLSTAPTNLLYGPLGAPVRLQQQGPHFVGFFSLALAGLALLAWALGRGSDPPGALLSIRLWVPAAAALAVFLVLLSLGRDFRAFGYELGPGLYRLLYYAVPGFDLVRIPERLSLLAMFFVSLLVGRGVSLVRERGFGRAAVLLAGVVPLEHLSPLPLTDRIPVGRDVPAVYRFLAETPVQALAELPIHGEALIRKESLEMYFSSYHHHPIIHGYATYEPLLTNLLRKVAAQFPSPTSFDVFQRIGVDTVVVHQGRPSSGELSRDLAPLVKAGRLTRLARFEGPAAKLHEGVADEVYRLSPGELAAPAPFPQGRRVTNSNWHYRTKAGDPLPATDGDLSTAWVVARRLNGDEFFEVTFDSPVPVSGVVLRLRRDSNFPTRFKIGARDLSGGWLALGFFDAAHVRQLLEQLLSDPRSAAVGFALGGELRTGLILMVDEGGTSDLGWSIPEFEVWVP